MTTDQPDQQPEAARDGALAALNSKWDRPGPWRRRFLLGADVVISAVLGALSGALFIALWVGSGLADALNCPDAATAGAGVILAGYIVWTVFEHRTLRRFRR